MQALRRWQTVHLASARLGFHAAPWISLHVRILPLILLLLAACEVPPTQQQVTSRAVIRNCEARAAAAADQVRKQNTQIIKEASEANQKDSTDVEERAENVREETFKSCMFEYSV